MVWQELSMGFLTFDWIIFNLFLIYLDISVGIRIVALIISSILLFLNYWAQHLIIKIESRIVRAILKFLPAIINASLAIVYTKKKAWKWKLIASIRDSALLFQLKNAAVQNRNLESRMLNVIDTILMQYLTFAIQALITLNWYDFGADLICVAIATICLYTRIIDFARHICNR